MGMCHEKIFSEINGNVSRDCFYLMKYIEKGHSCLRAKSGGKCFIIIIIIIILSSNKREGGWALILGEDALYRPFLNQFFCWRNFPTLKGNHKIGLQNILNNFNGYSFRK